MPHYVAAVPNPKAALALLRRLERMTGIAVEASELEEETTDYEEQIGRAVAANPEIEELVERIEAEQVDMLADKADELPRPTRSRASSSASSANAAAAPSRLRFRPPGRRAGSRTRSRRSATARLEVLRQDPSPTVTTVRSTRSASSGLVGAGIFSASRDVVVGGVGGLDVQASRAAIR